MTPIPVWSGVVTAEGKLRLDALSQFTGYVRTLRNTAVSLTLKRATRPKSTSQLGYLFGVVYPVIAEDLGYRDYEIDVVHDAVIRRLRGDAPEPNPLHLRASLAAMSHELVSAYIDDVRHWALTDYGIVTPDAVAAEPKE